MLIISLLQQALTVLCLTLKRVAQVSLICCILYPQAIFANNAEEKDLPETLKEFVGNYNRFQNGIIETGTTITSPGSDQNRDSQ
jgi:hypothetical protein